MREEMTSRQRFFEAVTHGNPDRAVYDLSGSPQTNIDYEVTRKDMMRLLGFTGAHQGPFNVDVRVLEALHIDTRRIGGMPTPATSHIRQENGIFYDSWGIGHRDVGGHMEMCYHPLKDADIDEMMAYELPDPEKLDMHAIRRWAEQAKYLYENTDYAIIGEHPVLGVFEIGCWMHGFEDYLYRLAGEPEYVHAFSQRILAYQKKVIEAYYSELGRYIDCTTSGDDFGTQTGPFMSLGMFEEYISPYLKERIAYTRQFTDAFYKHHTCGSVHSFIPSLIDCGVDILNPIQPGVYMMECDRLKADFGDRIAFWGGIDTQHLLPEGSEADVKNEVKRILSVMDKNGGYILSSAHTIQYDVPAENVIAIFRGADEYYGR